MTPSDSQWVNLFPSLLTACSEGKSKGARKRARRRSRAASWDLVEIMWAYFTFLDGGSPYKHHDQKRLLGRAASAPWTSSHAAYANGLHDEIHRYVRLQSSEPLSRGILKLNELVKVVRNSDYSSNHDIDKLARVARTIKPERMSLLQRAGIVSPDQFLKGAHLEAFKSMPSSVPLGVEPAVPTKGCFHVDPDDIHQVNLK